MITIYISNISFGGSAGGIIDEQYRRLLHLLVYIKLDTSPPGLEPGTKP